ncbi:MAG: hypothetical protein HY699_21195 [Deltaproteobacteria bacterium]|nr:hypothetical protein [Deltaproteobacteria bacterium]
MADVLQPCCVAAREAYVRRLVLGIVSYPVIKSFPCPECRRIVPVRLYAPPGEAGESA